MPNGPKGKYVFEPLHRWVLR